MAGINLLDQLKGKKVKESSSISSSSGLKFSLPSSSSDDIKHIVQLIILGSIFFGIYYYANEEGDKQASVLRSESEAIQQKLASAGRKKSQMRSIGEEMKGYQSRMDELRSKDAAVRELENNRNYLVRALDYVAIEMPRALWFTEISGGKEDAQMTFSGYAFDAQAVSEFIQKLESSVYFPTTTLQRLETVVGSDIKESTGSAVSIPANSRRFSISAKMGE